MEFFRIIDVSTTEEVIQKTFEMTNLALLSSQLFLLEAVNDEKAEIGSFWGEFTLRRTVVKGGLRFALSECPNALAWTITTGYEPSPGSVILHLTINRTQKDDEFIEELNDFMDDQVEKIKESIKVIQD
jgi:hypothetical protein